MIYSGQSVFVGWWHRLTNLQMIGKTFDTFCPIGPAIVSKDEVDVHNLAIKCTVSGEVRT